MEDPITFDDDDSSHYSLTDSDKIDSDIEAELYSKIHYDSNLSCTNFDNLNEKPSERLVYSPGNTNIFCVHEEKNTSTPTRPTNEHPFQNQITCDNFSSQKRKSSEMKEDFKTPNKKSSPVKKHKSVKDSPLVVFYPNGSENTNDSLQPKMNDIENKKTIFNSKQKSNKKNSTIVLDSSDSDSDIWMEPISADKSDLQINLIQATDTIFLSSSDSDDATEVSSPFVRRDSILKNLSMPNITMDSDENSGDLWQINVEDLYRSRRNSFRYHTNNDVTCSNCNQKGHTFRACYSPKAIKCFFCGGQHFSPRCPARMCSNCYSSGHDRKGCYRRINRELCQICNMEGHGETNCPDLWRRYHLTTTTNSEIKKAKRVKQDTGLYCWNCGQCGHFGSVCPLPRLSKSGISTWPCVVNYKSPPHLFKGRIPLLKRFNQAKQNIHLNSPYSSNKNDIHFQPRNELNVCNGSNEENRKTKGKNKAQLRFSQAQSVVQERNFPRMPKKKSPIKCPPNFEKSENESGSAQLLIKQQLKKLRKQWIRQRKRTNLDASESRATEDGASEIYIEDNLPESIKLQVEKIFKKWKKNKLRVLRRRIIYKQNKSKVEMDTPDTILLLQKN